MMKKSINDIIFMFENDFLKKTYIRIENTVKHVYNDHPWDPKFVAVVDRWSLFRGTFMLQKFKMGPQNGGRYRQVVAIRRWSLALVLLYIYSKFLKPKK